MADEHHPGCRCPACGDDWAVAEHLAGEVEGHLAFEVAAEGLAGEIEAVHRFWSSTEPIVIRRGDQVTLRTSAAELARRRFERERERDGW